MGPKFVTPHMSLFQDFQGNQVDMEQLTTVGTDCEDDLSEESAEEDLKKITLDLQKRVKD